MLYFLTYVATDVKIVKYGDVFGATTVQFSSLLQLVHPYELLASKGIYSFPSTLFYEAWGIFFFNVVLVVFRSLSSMI